MTDLGCLTLIPLPAECSQLSIVGTEYSWGEDTRTVTNPCPGSGNTLLFISVAPGENFDVGGETWVAPAGATQLDDHFEPGSFVPRHRMWTALDTGLASYTFGFNTNNPTPRFNEQTSIIICLSDQAIVQLANGPTVDVDTAVAFPSLNSSENMLNIAVATSQKRDLLVEASTIKITFCSLFAVTPCRIFLLILV